jgi:chitin-binding protein
VGDREIAEFDDAGRIPGATVSHQVDFGDLRGRQKVLAVWNIGDTANAFYNCVDLNVGGGSSSTPTTAPGSSAPTAPSSSAPTATATAAPTATGSSSSWAAGVSYKTGDVVTYGGKRYQCRQSHTAINSWEPSIYTLALWLPL